MIRKMRVRGPCVILSSLVLAVCAVFLAPGPGRGQESEGAPPAKKGRGGEVHGSVYADLGKAGTVPLPGFSVSLSLKDGDGRPVATVPTDAYGRFLFRRQPPGKYRLGWDEPGWAAPDGVAVEVGAATAYVPPLAVRPRPHDAAERPLGVLRGSVRLADDSSPWFTDEFFGVAQAAEVVVTDREGKAVPGGKVLADARGDFVVAGLRRQDLAVAARVVQRRRSDKGWTDWQSLGKTRATVAVPAARFDKGEVVSLDRLTLPGRRPEFVSVTATVDGKKVDAVRPGTTVVCTPVVSREDEKGLKYTWKVPGSNATGAEPVFTWKVGDYEGMQTAYLLVSNDKGGHAKGRITLSVGRAPK
ncbi:MAG: hypothetical protein HYS12_18770 [Planctomycetes bacterium]|nr:hypothetical protein [Planctomycetota bacterium]